MRVRAWCGAMVCLFMAGLAPGAFAQGDPVGDEIKRAVERAVGASIATSVAESLSRSIVSEGLQVMPRTTIFGSPFYNRVDGSVSFGSFKTDVTADTYGGVFGALFKVNDILLLHGALSGAHTSTEVRAPGIKASADGRFFEARVGADVVFLNTAPVKGWLTLEGGVSNFDTSLTTDVWSWRAGPSATLSFRGGPILFEPTVGVAFSNTFDDPGDTVTALQSGFALKYRGERFRPQLNFTYAKVIDPDGGDDRGFISAGPEILYAVTPGLLLGAAYSYGRSLNEGIDLNSHTVTLEARWTF